MLIRVATRKDNQALLDLSRQAPMDAKLVANIDYALDIPFLNISVDLQGQFTNCPIVYQLKFILNYPKIFVKFISIKFSGYINDVTTNIIYLIVRHHL